MKQGDLDHYPTGASSMQELCLLKFCHLNFTAWILPFRCMFRRGLFFCQVSIVVSSIEDDLASNASERRLSTKTSDTKLPSITGGNIFFVNSLILQKILHPGVPFLGFNCQIWHFKHFFWHFKHILFCHLKHHLYDILNVNFGFFGSKKYWND